MDDEAELRAANEDFQKWFVGLGMVTHYGAFMEQVLRETFYSLVGSKYASVVAGGQDANWLIEQCRGLLSANLELSASTSRPSVKALLPARTQAEHATP